MADRGEAGPRKLAPALSTALLIWWTVRLSTRGALSFEDGISIGVMSHFGLIVLLTLWFGLQSIGPTSFIDRFRSVLKPAVLYAMLASGSTVLFHHVVCAEMTELRQLERERFIGQSLSDEDTYRELQAEDPGLADLPREVARQRAMDSLKFQFDPRWHFTAALLLWMAAAMTTALFTSGLCQWLRS